MGGWSSFVEHLDHRRLRVLDCTTWASMAASTGSGPCSSAASSSTPPYYGTDQTQAQRILAARDERTVRQLLLFNGLLRFPITLAVTVLAAWSWCFRPGNREFRAAIPLDKPDLMIPVFISNYLRTVSWGSLSWR